MGKFRDSINSKLCECEDLEQSLENLLNGIKEFKEKGGVAKFIMYPKGGTKCESIITEKTVDTFVKVLTTEYNDSLKEVRKEINESFERRIKIT